MTHESKLKPISKVDCPHCQTQVQWTEESKFRPFCSKRCKLIDFGDWANESNKISSDLIEADDFMSEDINTYKH